MALCPRSVPPPAQIYRDLTGREEEANPVKKLYNGLFKGDIGRWISACAVIGLSAGVISKHPGQRMLAAAAFNLAVGSLHFFMFKVPVCPKGLTNPRPPTWYILLLAISTAMWVAAFVVIFSIREAGESYDVFSLEKRRTGAFTEIGAGTLALLENIRIACGCFGVSAFLFCIYQSYVVHRLFTTGFKKSEMREGYRKINKIEIRKEEETGATV
ncbi:hypothetical protein ACJ41O_008724 [Fusarium nematophilum]